MDGRLYFEKPGARLEKDILRFKNQFFEAGESVINGSGGLDFYPDFTTWIEYLARVESGQEEGFVPSEIWLARAGENGAIVGILDIRPRLPKEQNHFGHIGYAVAPGQRKKGYATEMIAFGLSKLKEAGLLEVLAYCYEDNAASRRVLEKSGFAPDAGYTEEESGKKVCGYGKRFEK